MDDDDISVFIAMEEHVSIVSFIEDAIEIVSAVFNVFFNPEEFLVIVEDKEINVAKDL